MVAGTEFYREALQGARGVEVYRPVDFRPGVRNRGLIFNEGVLYLTGMARYDSPEANGGQRPYDIAEIHIPDYGSREGGGSVLGEGGSSGSLAI
ncbi:MAG: hypothetical protein KJ718_00015 [Nanoarchaeota archaeon]|nr:hypothetical protein [Nanoarchaeota archaeon]MBU1050926.1 hypothetical protein [Nanoarchaeota archaeon]